MFDKNRYDLIETEVGVRFQFQEDCSICENAMTGNGCKECAKNFLMYITERFFNNQNEAKMKQGG